MTATDPGGQPGGDSAGFWDTHYRRHANPGTGPNPVLVDLSRGLVPGAALDLGCGEGGDALWLARHGWRVTAVDVSATVLARAGDRARAAGLAAAIDWQQHDLGRSFPTGTFDLVSAQYLQTPVPGFPRTQVLRAAARAVAPGGMLLVVDHGSVPPWSWAAPDTRFPTAQQLLDQIGLPPDAWRPHLVASPERDAVGPAGERATVVDIVVAAQRR